MAREDGKGNIWFGTEGNGLLCHNAGTDKIVQYWLEGKEDIIVIISLSLYV